MDPLLSCQVLNKKVYQYKKYRYNKKSVNHIYRNITAFRKIRIVRISPKCKKKGENIWHI